MTAGQAGPVEDLDFLPFASMAVAILLLFWLSKRLASYFRQRLSTDPTVTLDHGPLIDFGAKILLTPLLFIGLTLGDALSATYARLQSSSLSLLDWLFLLPVVVLGYGLVTLRRPAIYALAISVAGLQLVVCRSILLGGMGASGDMGLWVRLAGAAICGLSMYHFNRRGWAYLKTRWQDYR